LVQKEGTGRAPSHAPDSDETIDSKRAFVLPSEEGLKNGIHTAIHHNHVEDLYGPHWTIGLEPHDGKKMPETDC